MLLPQLPRRNVRSRWPKLFALRGRALLRRVIGRHCPQAMRGRQVHGVDEGDSCVKLPRVPRRQFLYHVGGHTLCGEFRWWVAG